MRDCGLALLWFSQSILVAIVTRDVEELEKKSCGICDNDYSALSENISQGLVAIVTRHFERIEKKILWQL